MKDFKNIAPSELLDYIDRQMKINNKKQYEVLRELAIDSRYIGKLRHQLNRQLKTSTSTLSTRIKYCKLINDGVMTVKEVANHLGYNPRTVRLWLNDFNTYGYSMLDRAVGFSHV